MKTELDPFAQFPIPCTAEDPIPKRIWPDLKGIAKARISVMKSDLKNWKEFWKTAVNFPIVSIDTETSGLKPFHGSRIVGVAAAYYDGKNIVSGYWNFRHAGHPKHKWCSRHDADTKPGTRKTCASDHPRWKVTDCLKAECPGHDDSKTQLPIELLKDMVPVFENCIVAGQSYKFDMKFFFTEGLPFPKRTIDTMLVAHLFDEMKKSYSLDTLSKEMGELKLGDSVKEYMTEHSLEVEGHGHEQVAFDVEAPYARADTELVLKRLQWERERWLTLADPKLMDTFQVEMAQSVIFAKMECSGMRLQIPYVKAGIIQFEEEMADLEKKIYKEAGKVFNILSLDELWDVLSKRGLQAGNTSLLSSTTLRETMRGERTKSGKPSINDIDLMRYSDEGDKLCPLIKEYRTRNKMCGTYFKPFIETHADAEGFVHADFKIHGTTTGRISCQSPNLTNMTKLEKFGTTAATGSLAAMIHTKISKKEDRVQHNLEVRRCFIPRSPDHSLFFFDEAQMELRVFADYASEEFMMDALKNGLDVHAAVARKIFPNFPESKEADPKIYSWYRTLAKQISFGLLYGMGVNKLARQLSAPVDDTVRALMMIKAAAGDGYDITKVTTLSLEEVDSFLEDHRVMTETRQWSGLKVQAREVSMKVLTEPLEEFLFGTKEMKEKHTSLLYSARNFLQTYHSQFPRIKIFTKGIEKAIASRGFLFNRYGRRYHLNVNESYIGINRLVQGSSGEMVKLAQWRIDRLLEGKKSKMINQIHDEIQVDLHHDELHLVPLIKKCLEYYPNFEVKMSCEVEYSHSSWAQKSKWEGPEKFLESLKEFKKISEKPKPKKKTKVLA